MDSCQKKQLNQKKSSSCTPRPKFSKNWVALGFEPTTTGYKMHSPHSNKNHAPTYKILPSILCLVTVHFERTFFARVGGCILQPRIESNLENSGCDFGNERFLTPPHHTQSFTYIKKSTFTSQRNNMPKTTHKAKNKYISKFEKKKIDQFILNPKFFDAFALCLPQNDEKVKTTLLLDKTARAPQLRQAKEKN